MTGRAKPRPRASLKPPTKESLRRAALAYLERYASSRENLRQVLQRRLLRAEYRGLTHDCSEADIEEILTSLSALGLLDDRNYAENRVRALHRRGWSRHRIQADLRRKGLLEDDVTAAFAALAEEEPNLDLAAAMAFARRRRLGPFRSAEARGQYREKDLARLARQGFDYETARSVIDAETDDQRLA